MTDWFAGKRVGSFQQELNRVFTDFGLTPPAGLGAAFGGLSSQPRVEVEKTKTGYEIEITLPFPVEAGRIEAEVREGKLVITADRPPETGGSKVDIRTGAGSAGAAAGGDAQPRPGGTGASDAAHGGGGSASFTGHGSDAPSGMMGQGGQPSSGEGMMGEGV